MVRKKSKRTPEEIRDRRADKAWAYRQRNRETVNEKARLRMRQKREALKSAPSAVQLEHAIRSEQYRRHYMDRCKEAMKPLPKLPGKVVKASSPVKAAVQTPPRQRPRASKAPPTPKKKGVAPPQSPSVRTCTPSEKKTREPTQVTLQSRARVSGSPCPRSLADIDKDDDEDTDEEGWEGDSEREKLGPLLNATGHPDYVPEPGQTCYIRNGRRYWF
ncbi:hypothetical protein C8R47DRAFT_1224965 [Mycena vitilis]|nr:hypothetical protein C8R47DRAFT_1230643 [Mycena vitilis]KAJ6463808.1 hypothetical protein C8R47DRAFT_1224965 [Mycena vitilis]